jgi:hypothetical protein
MVRIQNNVYFAPDIRFSDLDWSDPYSLVDPFSERVHLYFFDPIIQLLRYYELSEFVLQNDELLEIMQKNNRNNDNLLQSSYGVAFSVGLLCSTAIDFFSAIEFYPSQSVGTRYEDWLLNRIPILDQADPNNPGQTLAKRFYKDFRNGLVHEGRIKNAGQFTFQDGLFTDDQLFNIVEGAMVINPVILFNLVTDAFDEYRSEVVSSEFNAQKFRCALTGFFSEDVAYATRNQ